MQADNNQVLNATLDTFKTSVELKHCWRSDIYGDSIISLYCNMLALVDGKDTTLIVYLQEVNVFPDMKFKNEKEKQEYTKLVRDVKRAYPYARLKTKYDSNGKDAMTERVVLLGERGQF